MVGDFFFFRLKPLKLPNLESPYLPISSGGEKIEGMRGRRFGGGGGKKRQKKETQGIKSKSFLIL